MMLNRACVKSRDPGALQAKAADLPVLPVRGEPFHRLLRENNLLAYACAQ